MTPSERRAFWDGVIVGVSVMCAILVIALVIAAVMGWV